MKRRLPIAAMAAFAVTMAAGPVAAENRTAVEITAVMASNDGRSFDSRLASLKTELRSLRFKSYQYISSESRVLRGNGEQCGIALPGDRYLHITTREHTPEHVRVHILLNEHNRPVINTYVKLEHDSVVLLGGPRDPQGTLIISIGVKPAEPPTDADGARKRSPKVEPREIPQGTPQGSPRGRGLPSTSAALAPSGPLPAGR